MDWSCFYSQFESSNPYLNIGKVTAKKGQGLKVRLPNTVVGAQVRLVSESGEEVLGEVISFEQDFCLVMPYEEMARITSRTRVYLSEQYPHVEVGMGLLGKAVDAFAKPLDGKKGIEGELEKRSLQGKILGPLERPPIGEPLDTGIRAINSFLTLGRGQRMGIMAGSGVGKSVLMGMIAKNTSADINVIALIGERGREVREFIESDLGPEGLKKSVVVVSTSDESPLKKVRAAYTATTIAEYFRDQGLDVLLMMDSVTRFAMANREIGMNIGEPPGPKGYGPSVFSKLPSLLERAGTSENGGAITGIYTVLVEGDDMEGPISDAVRSITDGHIVLDRALAGKNHFPAIDIARSISRLMPKVVTKEHRIVSGYLRNLLAAYRESEDLINVGAYAEGTNAQVDKAIAIHSELEAFLKQDFDETSNIDETYERMVEIAHHGESSANSEKDDQAS